MIKLLNKVNKLTPMWLREFHLSKQISNNNNKRHSRKLCRMKWCKAWTNHLTCQSILRWHGHNHSHSKFHLPIVLTSWPIQRRAIRSVLINHRTFLVVSNSNNLKISSRRKAQRATHCYKHSSSQDMSTKVCTLTSSNSLNKTIDW